MLRRKIVGICGAHRTGKSTLMRALTDDKHSLKFVEFGGVSISKWLNEIDCNSSDLDCSWEQRKIMQTHLLQSYKQRLATYRAFSTIIRPAVMGVEIPQGNAYPTTYFFVDRTPIDLIGYLLESAARHELTEDDRMFISNYVNSCIELTAENFDYVFIVQPGIPLVSDPKSAPADSDLVEFLNSIYLAHSLNSKLSGKVHIIPRDVVDLEQRVSFIKNRINES